MIGLLQRVQYANGAVNNIEIAAIEQGLLMHFNYKQNN